MKGFLTMRKPIRLITAGEIKQYYSMKQAIDSMERAFSLLSSGEGFVPLRFVSKLPSSEMMMLFKPAYVEKEKRISVKFLTQRENGFIPELPIIQGVVLIIDADTGEILSLMDGEYLTALRTGAASGLATRCFARKDANILALFGCGAQGRTQMEAVVCERDIKKVMVFDKNKDKADRFIMEMQEKFQIEMIYASDTSLLNEADIICTTTNSTTPLFNKEVLKKGVHINAIGSFQPHMQELDPFILRDAKVYVDQIESCLKESGDFIKPIAEGIIQKSNIIGEIGDFCLNKIEGRKSENEITVFKSVGIAIQDYTVATDIYNNSFENSFGHDINLFE
jgi:ornithine cyclodeaminase/alanine dehydrogenase-like protein (mu-crystallin family)